MRKIIKISLAFLLLSGSLSAALAPLHQSIKEWETVMKSPEITTAFTPNETLQSVMRSGDSFTICSQEKQVIVDLIYVPSQMVGPKQFKLVFHNPTPIE